MSAAPAAALMWLLAGQATATTTLPILEKALARDRVGALSALDAAQLPEAQAQAVRGLILLSLGDRRAARPLLSGAPYAAYRAMAEQGDPGGLGRAQEILAKAAEAEDAATETLFLAALAYAARGQAEVADKLLARAVKQRGALDPAWAPDPAARLVEALGLLNVSLTDEEQQRLELALSAAGRNGVRVQRGKTPAAGMTPLLGKALPKGVEAAKDVAEAEARLRSEPDQDRHRAALIDALISEGKLERAEALAIELLGRHPADLDPYGRLAKIAEARGQKQKAEAQTLRSRAHRAQLDRRRAELAEREKALLSVADAESGVGLAGLESQRVGLLHGSLPFDLAIARQGKPGEARAARDRILAACARRLPDFLEHQGPWEQFTLRLTVYGKPTDVVTRLPAANPARCTE